MARRLIERILDDSSFPMTREGLRLYLIVLEALGEYSEMLAVLKHDARMFSDLVLYNFKLNLFNYSTCCSHSEDDIRVSFWFSEIETYLIFILLLF